MLVERFGGRVPATMEELLTLPGVGRKTANLVLILAFKSQQNICVDTHVHRISNRSAGCGRARRRRPSRRSTRRPTQRWWPYINLYLVTWGQNVCRPVYPRCGECVHRAHVSAASASTQVSKRSDRGGRPRDRRCALRV